MDIIGVLTVVGLVLWVVLCLTIIVGLFVSFPTLKRMHTVLTRLDRILERAEGRLEPSLARLRSAADNVDYVTTALRSDVDAMGDTVDRAAESTRRMLELAEERATEIAGFLEVVQEEAEDTFFTTASLLRALRGGRSRAPARDEPDRGGRRSA